MAVLFNQAMKAYKARQFQDAFEAFEDFLLDCSDAKDAKVQQACSQARQALLQCYVHINDAPAAQSIAIELLQIYLPTKTINRLLHLSVDSLVVQLCEIQPKLPKRWTSNHESYCKQITAVAEQCLHLKFDMFWICIYAAFRLKTNATVFAVAKSVTTSPFTIPNSFACDMYTIMASREGSNHHAMLLGLCCGLVAQDAVRVARITTIISTALEDDALDRSCFLAGNGSALHSTTNLADAWLRCHVGDIGKALRSIQRRMRDWPLQATEISMLMSALAVVKLKYFMA
eukprot:TRINITY_DN10872_c1_g3_i1.p1 TRINITY_DN10872_c1_g3~~TRINITY_DN10872_c1_g3_i1.p1  ORF type:complete len:287 (+),score=32.62 TRINITY_DN10872_c1_g3_i1:30-890(+)